MAMSTFTMFKLFKLSMWTPPVGVERSLVVHEDGTIEVHLRAGLVYEIGHQVPPDRTVKDRLFADLDRSARELLDDDRSPGGILGEAGDLLAPDDAGEPALRRAGAELDAAIARHRRPKGGAS